MGGRHRRSSRRGRGGRSAAGGLTVIATGVGMLVFLTGSWGVYRALTNTVCAQRIRVGIAAAPEIAPAVRDTAAGAAGSQGLRLADKCVSVDVAAVDPADVAAAVAGRHQSSLGGLGSASGKTKVPDVWIPDSSMWLQRLRVGQDWVPDDAPSVASSPVVLAVPEPVATALGWPDKKFSWGDLLPRLTSDAKLRTGIVEPSRDAAGLAGLLALTAAGGADTGAVGQQKIIGVMRTLATGRSTLRDELVTRFPRAGDAVSLAKGLSAAPMTEQSVIAYNARQPSVRLAALYTDPGPVPLDYPFAIMPGASVEKAAAANAVLGLLAGEAYRNRLAAAGLRGEDGGVGTRFTAPRNAPSLIAPVSAAPDAARIDTVLATWSAITSPGRMLAAVDVSDSMLLPVPTAGGASREQVTVEAARRAMALFDDNWAAGLWTFSTQLDGFADYRQLVPLGPLGDQRQQLLDALGGITPVPGGKRGLYDSTLAAYRAVQSGWDPSRVNSVVIMTDGRSDDPQGLSLDQLTSKLKQVMDPARPIEVIMIGIGPDVSEPDLKRITDTTGGGTFVATDPAKIGDVFLKAIALRTSVKR